MSSLNNAKKVKNDEFYTTTGVICAELMYYEEHFKDKIVYLNCDNPERSKFWEYFSLKFNPLGLKKLIATEYIEGGRGFAYIYEGTDNPQGIPQLGDIKTIQLEGDGDFRSEECVEYLKESDVVVTNPPFSLFRELIAQLIKYEKQFLLVGNNNAITYKDVFSLIKEEKVWLGTTYNKSFEFVLGDKCKRWSRVDKDGNKYGVVNGVSWFTNIENKNRNEKLFTSRKYYNGGTFYPKYENFDAIEVNRVGNIPNDYYGLMGVPITYLGRHNPNNFKLIDCCEPELSLENYKKLYNGKYYKSRIVTRGDKINHKTYHRILIQRIKED